jgi:hypothetical protein
MIDGPPYFTFVTAVMDRRLVPPAEWRSWFIGECADFDGFKIDAGGEILDSDNELAGFCRFIEEDEAATLFAGEPWYREPVECPWIGAVMGYFTWTLVVSGDLSRSFAATVAYVGRGVIARPREGWSRNPVALVTCWLNDMLDRHGLEDGNALLDRHDDAYLDDVVARVRWVVTAAGFDPGGVDHHDARHNPLRCTGELRRLRDDELVEASSALSGLTVEIWTFRSQIFDDDRFWCE